MMEKILFQKLIAAKNLADKKISKLDKLEIRKLEEDLDVEHAYYSSVLEGSKLDRGEFEELAKQSK